jgi:DNA helicase-2/ATP-dependent DNA helicase PcrA
LEEGLLPSSRSLHDDSAIEEERRLFYVGITRARERLLLSKSRYRYSFGQMSDQTPSSFLREIAEGTVITHDLCYMQPHAVKQLFSGWLGIQPSYEANVLTFGTTSPIKKAPAPSRLHTATRPVKQEKTNDGHAESSWKINQPVKHPTFGIGLIKKVEKLGDNISVTVNFGTQMKKVLSTFLTKI